MSFADLLTGPTTGEEGRALIRVLVTTAPYPVPLSVLDAPGAPEAAIVWALGEAEAVRSGSRVFFARSASRATATRPFLGVIAREVYGVPPRDADFATTNVNVTNNSGWLHGPFPPGGLRFVDDDTDQLFVNITEVTIPVGPITIPVSVRAVNPGSVGTAQPTKINRLETPLEGVSVSNPSAAVGQDAETATSLNDRIDAKIGSLGTPGARGWNTGGTATSFEAVAKNGPDDGGGVVRADGSRISVTRTRVVRDDATGVTTLYVADDDGPLTESDLVAVREVVQVYAEWLGLEVEVENATAVLVNVYGTLTITDAAASDNAIRTQIAVELTSAGRRVPLGGFPPSNAVSLKFVENAVESAGDAGKATAFTLVDIALSGPSGATALAVNEIPVFVPGTFPIVRV